MNKGFLKLVSLCLVGVLLSVSGYAQNYRVKAERYERGIYSLETNPPSVRYAIIDLGPDVEPIRLSNSGHVLCQPAKFGKLQSRWYQGQFQELTGGDDPKLVGTLDMNDAGTVVGSILEYKTGSVSGLPPCFDSERAWYRSPSYGIRRAAAWYAGSGGASLLGQPEYGFSIYDCSVPHGPPYTGTATFGSAWTIDDSGHIYGEAQAAYAEHQHYNPPPDDYWSPTVPAAAYSGFGFGGSGKLGDLALVYDPVHNTFTTEGTSYYVRKVRNGVTFGYDGKGKNFVNSLPVDFTPTTMNSQGLVLGAVVVDPNSFFGGYTKFLIFDPATRTQTDLPMKASRFFGPGQFHPPVALNHRTIAVTNSSGQTIFKKSPQIVGPSGAVIWEEDPKTGQYFYKSLNLLIPENSGWTLTSAKAINDDGAILCKGTFQPKDTAGNPVGNPQVRACLLIPAQFTAREGEINHGFDPTGSEPWASVTLGSVSQVVQFVTSPPELTARVTFSLASGNDSLEFSSAAAGPGKTYITLTGKTTPGTAIIEAKLDGGLVAGRLHVVVLPQRTLTVGIYRIEDSKSPKTAFRTANDPQIDQQIMQKLNEVYKQAGVKFEIAESVYKDLNYDENKNGIWEEGEWNKVRPLTGWNGQIRAFLVKEGPPRLGGASIDPSTPAFPTPGPGGILFVKTCGTILDICVAHEFGHALGLPAWPQSDEEPHDAGPWPAGTSSLMRAGNDAGVSQVPGLWLRHEDWIIYNTRAATPDQDL